MIRSLFFSAGQVATVLYGCARARADRLAELERDRAQDRRELACLRGLLLVSQAERAEVEQRCNLLAHHIREVEDDVRHWVLRGDMHKRWAARWKRLAAHHRSHRFDALSWAQQESRRANDAEQALADAERARELLRGERDEARALVAGLERDVSRLNGEGVQAGIRLRAAQRRYTEAEAKLELYQRGEDANRAQGGES